MKTNEDMDAVRVVLGQFQAGYDQRDPNQLETFRRLFVPEEDLEVIGTGAVKIGDDEWCLGPEAACTLVKNDWEGWGDLTLDVAGARIHVLGDVAWLATTGRVDMTLDPSETVRDYVDYIQKENPAEETDPQARLMEILRGGINTLFEAAKGSQYTWPIRFTAVLVRRDETWLFHQIQFSFATTRFPDVRSDKKE